MSSLISLWIDKGWALLFYKDSDAINAQDDHDETEEEWWGRRCTLLRFLNIFYHLSVQLYSTLMDNNGALCINLFSLIIITIYLKSYKKLGSLQPFLETSHQLCTLTVDVIGALQSMNKGRGWNEKWGWSMSVWQENITIYNLATHYAHFPTKCYFFKKKI